MAGEPGSDAPPSDPYATARANLRDTVKWLAAIFSALAAVVLAGSPISGLGKLDVATPAWWAAAACLVLAFVCICLALARTVTLLRSDALHLSDLDPEVALEQIDADERDEIAFLRSALDRRAVDVLPPNYETLASLIGYAKRRRREVKNAAQARRDAADSGSKQLAEARLQAEQQKMARLAPALSRVMAYGVYLRFYRRLRLALPRLFGLGVIALVALAGFGVLVADKPKEPPLPSVIVLPAAERKPALPALPELEPVLFATGSAVVQPQGLAALQRARQAMLDDPARLLLLLAFTDTVAGEAINTRLARQRAAAIKELLVGEGGIARSRVFVAELPKTALPTLTPAQTASDANRAVLMKLVLPQGPS